MSDSTEINKELMRLQYELQGLRKELDEQIKKLEKFNDALFEPDEGIYRRIKSVSEKIEENYKMLQAIEKKVYNKHEAYEQKIIELEAAYRTLIEIGGDNLSDLRTTVDKSKKSDKIMWAAVTTAVAAAVKLVWDIITNLIQ